MGSDDVLRNVGGGQVRASLIDYFGQKEAPKKLLCYPDYVIDLHKVFSMKACKHMQTRKGPAWLLTLFLFLSAAAIGIAQTPTDTLWVVETRDGNMYTGTLEDLGADGVRITTQVGTLTIPREQIVSIKRIEKSSIKDGIYWFDNPHTSRHFWGPSGYGLRKGEGYYQNTWILLNQVSYGFSDNFTVGVGLIPLFLFGVTSVVPAWVTPKFSFPYQNGKGAFGAGTILGGALGSDGEGIGILYGVNTFGTRERQLTVGLGYGYSTRGGFADLPTISVSGLARTGQKWAFVSENYCISSGSFTIVILSAGARYVGKSLAIDFGGIIPLAGDMDQLFAIPWLSIAVPFGVK